MPGSPDDRFPLRAVRIAAVTYFVLFAVAVTWPGMLVADRVEPLIFGLPFSLGWIAIWVVGGILALWGLDAAERRGGRE